MNLHEIGDRERPAYCYDMAEAVRVAQRRECKIWTKIDGETNVLYEVWPGGRNVRWTLDQPNNLRRAVLAVSWCNIAPTHPTQYRRI